MKQEHKLIITVSKKELIKKLVLLAKLVDMYTSVDREKGLSCINPKCLMQPQGAQSLQRETELQMEHKAQVQVRSSPIQVNNVLNYQNYEHFREIAG